jgi:hypothetical protein
MLFLLIMLAALARSQNDNAILTRLQRLETQLAATEDLLRQFTAGQALLYKDMDHCPPGFYPADVADGRLILIEGHRRGHATDHSISTNNGMRMVNAKCMAHAEVAESGVIEVCVNTGDNMGVEMDLKQVLPTYSLFLCLRDNDVAGLSNPRVT